MIRALDEPGTSPYRGDMRGLSLCRLPLTFALAAACGGGELTLPGAGDPATLVIVAGDGQLGPKGQLLADPLVVEVRDGIGRPVAGADVAFRFTVEVPDASVDPGAAPTDGLGRASAHAQLGNRSGAQPIEATVAVPGEDLRVRFQLTALPDDPPPDGTGGGGGGSGNGVVGRGLVAGTTLAPALHLLRNHRLGAAGVVAGTMARGTTRITTGATARATTRATTGARTTTERGTAGTTDQGAIDRTKTRSSEM